MHGQPAALQRGREQGLRMPARSPLSGGHVRSYRQELFFRKWPRRFMRHRCRMQPQRHVQNANRANGDSNDDAQRHPVADLYSDQHYNSDCDCYADSDPDCNATGCTIIGGLSFGVPGSLAKVLIFVETWVARRSDKQRHRVQQRDLYRGSEGLRARNSRAELTANLVEPGRLRIFVQPIDDAPLLADGPLYSCRFRIGPAVLPGTYPLSNQNVAAIRPSGAELAVVGSAGKIMSPSCRFKEMSTPMAMSIKAISLL